MFQFKAESMGDAIMTFCRWMECGVVPTGTYDIRENTEREGYFIEELV